VGPLHVNYGYNLARAFWANMLLPSNLRSATFSVTWTECAPKNKEGGGASKQGALDKLMLLLAPCGQIPQKTTSLIRVDPASLVVMDGQSNVCDMTGNLRFWRSTAAVVQFYCPNIRHGSDSHPDSSICLSTLLTAAKSSL
jgi:hypothetical protein